MRTITTLLLLVPVVTLSGESCKRDEPVMTTETGTVYVQYQRLGDGFRELKSEFTLTDYVFDREPTRSEWSMATNLNYVDRAKLATLIQTGVAKATTITGNSSVSLPTGYHILDDGGPNPVGFWLNATDRPLIWFNANYPYSKSHGIVTIILKNYPAPYNLTWWFFSHDLIDPATTVDELLTRFTDDGIGSDYDAGFSAMPSAGRSFRAPAGIGYIVVKTPANTYQAARINVGETETVTVTFTAP